VNAFDVVVLGLVATAAYGGFRLGLFVRVLSWAGMAVGGIAALRLGRPLVEVLDDASPETRLVAVLVLFVTLASAGQAIGVWAGGTLRQGIGHVKPLAATDRVAGGVLGGAGILVALWLLAPTFESAQGWPERAVESSFLVDTVDRVAPDPPDALVAFDDLFDDGTFPRVFDAAAPDPQTPPPAVGLDPTVHDQVVRSTVLVEGEACSRVQHGSGFVAGPDLVVTNAHVVAGEPETRVLTSDGRELDARVVAFDPSADLAVLHVDDLGVAPLTGAEPEEGELGAVYGHPGGGDLRAAPARVDERIRGSVPDIYRETESTRDMLVLAAQLAPGDSGSPVVSTDGQVVGIAFAIDPDSGTVAYAFEWSEIAAVLTTASAISVPTGDCLDT
jgi:S1-C subfamily serine protease